MTGKVVQGHDLYRDTATLMTQETANNNNEETKGTLSVFDQAATPFNHQDYKRLTFETLQRNTAHESASNFNHLKMLPRVDHSTKSQLIQEHHHYNSQTG